MWIYLTALVLGLSAFVAVWLFRRHHRRAYFRGQSRAGSRGARRAADVGGVVDPVRSLRAANAEAPGGLAAASSELGDRVEPDPYLAEGEQGHVRCSRCARVFPAGVAVCPFDMTPLGGSVDEDALAEAFFAQEHLDRKFCVGCQRRYPASADYCYHDGVLLDWDTRKAAAVAPVLKACGRCGWEGQAEGSRCAQDGARLIEINPAAPASPPPTIPLMRCPECYQVAPPGTTRCARDRALLEPLGDLTPAHGPRAGFGPRRKICPSCGARFSGEANYCSSDATRLVLLN